jgi:hypothetical protein
MEALELQNIVSLAENSDLNLMERRAAVEKLYGVGRKAIRFSRIPNAECFITFRELRKRVENLKHAEVDDEDKEAGISLAKFMHYYRGEIKEIFGLPYRYKDSEEINPVKFAKWQEVDGVGVEKKLLPPKMAESWIVLREEFRKSHPEMPLAIASAYRSPAYQLYLICYYGHTQAKSLADKFQVIAPPYHSAHNRIPPALDIADFFSRDPTQAGSVMQSGEWNDFVGLAAKFKFHLNYRAGPNAINGGLGEPWEVGWRP